MDTRLKVGAKAIYKPIDYRTMEPCKDNPWYGSTITITELQRIFVQFSFDDFPKVNNREYHNRYHCGYDEIELIDTEGGAS